MSTGTTNSPPACRVKLLSLQPFDHFIEHNIDISIQNCYSKPWSSGNDQYYENQIFRDSGPLSWSRSQINQTTRMGAYKKTDQ